MLNGEKRYTVCDKDLPVHLVERLRRATKFGRALLFPKNLAWGSLMGSVEMHFGPMFARLSRTQKFAILSVMTLILATIPSYCYINESDKILTAATTEIHGIGPLSDLRSVVQLTQQHRGLAALSLGGIKSVDAARASKQHESDQAYTLMSANIQGIQDREIQENWKTVRQDWDKLRLQVSSGNMTVEDSYQAHVDLIAELLNENELIADYYGLNLDPDRDTYQLIQFMYYQLPHLTEETGEARAKGAGLLVQKTISERDRVLMAAIDDRAGDRYARVVNAYNKAREANIVFQTSLDEDLRKMLDMTSDALHLANTSVVQRGAITYSPTDYVTQFTQAIDSQFKAAERASAVLQNTLENKVSKLHRTRMAMLGITLLLFALISFLHYNSVARSTS